MLDSCLILCHKFTLHNSALPQLLFWFSLMIGTCECRIVVNVFIILHQTMPLKIITYSIMSFMKEMMSFLILVGVVNANNQKSR